MAHARRLEDVESVSLIVGLEVHVELATRTKMFSRALSPAFAGAHDAPPNSFIDPTVLGLPGALPTLNMAAVEMAMAVGLALNCQIARRTKWDRKSYFYPDLPKSYQISQYDMPLCFDGAFDLPAADALGYPDFDGPTTRIGIVRAHLEEDAGKLLHEAPGGGAIDVTLADYNRAGTPLLEIVTQPDFRSADQVVLFCRLLREICRYAGVTEGVMQRGQMRFEPNINCKLALRDGRLITTPIVEVKNLNSFKSVKGAIEFELAQQPARWVEDGREMGPGQKTTRGWDDVRNLTVVQREKEDAQDYRYFPDPDLPALDVDEAWVEEVRGRLPEMSLARLERCVKEYELGVKEASQLVEERATSDYFERAVDGVVLGGVVRSRAGKATANVLLQSGARRANEQGKMMHELGLSAAALAELVLLREKGQINNQAVDVVFGELCAGGGAGGPGAREIALARGLIIERDDAAMSGWIDTVLAANDKVAADVRAGKVQAVGRLVGEVMKLAGGKADAKTVREAILAKLGVTPP
ncbi:MAG: Asp-tRNA(Asn)/Glu-tRNA(Gln) amidotransferase subunit GatB [Tepidisphaera sp.]|nr:Asp-tRNA(Asn)/Glu-tRNA(Gln) amidotransferase subunit GatB [Tepidisphaera sp.]